MKFFRKLWETFRMMWKSVFGRLALDTMAGLIATLGKEAVDILVEKGKDRAARLENEYPAGSGPLKAAELGDYLADIGTSLGLNLAKSTLNLIIEIIVNSMRNKEFLEPKIDTPTTPAPDEPVGPAA